MSSTSRPDEPSFDRPEQTTSTDWRLIDDSGRTIVERLELADRFWKRLIGLQGRRIFPLGAGLLLVPCSSVHTCFMRFPLDLVMLDREGRAVDVRPEVPPWRPVLPRAKTYAVLERPVGAPAVEIGSRLRAVGPAGAPLPAALTFLSPARPLDDRRDG